ncbi:MAG: hypothetical protein ACR2F1_06755 [Nitrososphaeraceae archaeon]
MAGPEGPLGPAGPNQINTTSIYTVQGNFNASSFGIGIITTSVAKCNPGDTVLSGSYRIVSNGIVPETIDDRALVTQDGWNTTIQKGNGANFGFLTLAQCFNNP